MTEISKDAYLEKFSGQGVQEKALAAALDIRKFEIELYWKRASYFWTFIAAMFAGYFALQKDASAFSEPAYIVTCLGFIFSIAWYFVNRGSKAWQRNWEIQVDLLEDKVMGPLYKSGLDRYTFNFWDITAGYPFSPSRINQIMSLFVVFVWLFLMIRTLVSADLCSNPSRLWTILFMSSLTIVGIVLLATKGRTHQTDEPIAIEHRQRKYKDHI